MPGAWGGGVHEGQHLLLVAPLGALWPERGELPSEDLPCSKLREIQFISRSGGRAESAPAGLFKRTEMLWRISALAPGVCKPFPTDSF